MKQASKRWTGFVLWLAVLTSAVTLAAAEPEDIIKYRKNAMKASGAHMAAAAAIVKGKVPFRDQLVVHARALEQINHDNTKLFPKDSDFGDTKALNAVWEKRADFREGRAHGGREGACLRAPRRAMISRRPRRRTRNWARPVPPATRNSARRTNNNGLSPRDPSTHVRRCRDRAIGDRGFRRRAPRCCAR